ncbi:exodeoxyribonuclease V subunit alpha [Marinobacter confluentis]|uniref:RecBCD enzyme subunit RecD n=1 Tax=Marinobacter confluentis TaxID=1697557 RepID=A0A4Z1BX91_9GAMM|nr:exodeoxyribonuclease V subunit alpha [Marinobacter confluentis]TGN39230.1 exodeoxyribonuclease V subunit alpha [Marinobacter confluentis]
MNLDSALKMLDYWVELGWLRALDHAFAEFVCTISAENNDAPTGQLAVLAAMVSHQVGRGHVCLDLSHLCADAEATLVMPPEGAAKLAEAPDSLWRPADLFQNTTADQLIESIRNSNAVSDGSHSTPLVLEGTRLYLRRFWRYEQAIAAGIRLRFSPGARENDQQLSRALDALFGKKGEVDYQKVACALAARNRFSVITGGPGTGKTTTVLNLLAALQSMASQSPNADPEDPYLRIRLSAPTGKAAARLSESIGGALSKVPLNSLPGAPDASAIPTEVTTLHRLLGSRPGSRQFRYNEDNPLPLDILVIDEASMVDVDLMASVFSALPETARLIMLGDKDQLASVDAGAVLGELCQRANDGHYRPETLDWLKTVTGYQLPDELADTEGQPLDQAVGMLRKSYRFDEHSGIGVLAMATNEGRFDKHLIKQCQSQDFPDVAWLGRSALMSDPAESPSVPDALIPLARHARSGSARAFANAGEGRVVNGEAVAAPVGYGHYLRIMSEQRPEATDSEADRPKWDFWAANVLSAFSQFQVLCALRKGPFGVDGLNRQVAAELRASGLIDKTEGWYAGRPVLVTGNDYNLGLMNGDIGVTLSVPWDRDEQGDPVQTLRVAFPSSDGSGTIRWISPSRLQSLETVYAMTVHKSQGSEFTHACLVITDRLTPVLTRELIYTGITRARHWLSLAVPQEAVLREAVGRSVVRASGLARLLS